jgi:hypothetical protein
MTANLQNHHLGKVITATPAAITAVPANVFTILLVGGSAATTVSLFDAADGNGTATITLAAPIGNSVFINLEALGPLVFQTKLWATVAGTGGVVYVWYD